jgi:tetrahydromethanopterin S-methyltransferase subunit G
MSVGDWFTLRPLNFITKEELDNDLNDIRSRLSNLENETSYIMNILNQTWDMITQNNLDILNLMSRVGALEGNVANINTQLQQLQGLPAQVNDIYARLNSLDGRVDTFFGRINNLELLYKKIDEYTLINFPFSQPLYTTYVSFQKGPIHEWAVFILNRT